jgi:hypothetical protein
VVFLCGGNGNTAFKYSGELLFDIILWLLNSIPKLFKLELFGYLSKTH